VGEVWAQERLAHSCARNATFVQKD
jgi:hypothetical protein